MQGLQNRQRNNANLLRVADLEGLEFNTPVPFFDTAVPCGVPGDLGDVPKIFIMMPNELVGPYDTYCTRATGDSMADLKIECARVSQPRYCAGGNRWRKDAKDLLCGR